MLQALHRIAADGGVGGDHAIHAMGLEAVGNHADLFFGQIGSDLQEYRLVLAMLAR